MPIRNAWGPLVRKCGAQALSVKFSNQLHGGDLFYFIFFFKSDVTVVIVLVWED